MNITVTAKILKAFELYKNTNDIPSDYELCAKLELSRATYSGWKSGRSKTVRSAIWDRIEPKLRPFIEVAEVEDLVTDDRAFEQMKSLYERARSCSNSDILIDTILSNMDQTIKMAEVIECSKYRSYSGTN
jgi:hypothetical protein